MARQDGQPGHRAQRAVPVRIAQSAAEQRVELSGQVVDGDQVAFGVGEGELPTERPVGGGGDDPDSGGGQLVMQRLRVVGLEPQRDPGAAGRPRPGPRRAAAPATANGIGAVANTTAPTSAGWPRRSNPRSAPRMPAPDLADQGNPGIPGPVAAPPVQPVPAHEIRMASGGNPAVLSPLSPLTVPLFLKTRRFSTGTPRRRRVSYPLTTLRELPGLESPRPKGHRGRQTRAPPRAAGAVARVRQAKRSGPAPGAGGVAVGPAGVGGTPVEQDLSNQGVHYGFLAPPR